MNESGAVERQRWLDLVNNRGAIYSFLSRVYEREVTLDLLKELSAEKGPLLQMANLNDLGEGSLREGFQELIGYLRGLGGRDMTQAKLELDVEYANLFLGVIGKPPHPSESVYSSSEHLVMQKVRDDVLFEYRKVGVDKVNEFTEPEDHIALELQFMAYLCSKTAEALVKGDSAKAVDCLEIQKTFLEKHLAVWVPKLTKDILESGTVDFYRGAAKITEGFVAIDKDSIAELIENTKPR
jgi:anaerobic sulfite reductase subunit A